ncbi:MAG: hypothetical protein K8I60_17865 [Anaerolineae bacterium]|nr:hypothetical protein [Anaerolineae bacterium]
MFKRIILLSLLLLSLAAVVQAQGTKPTAIEIGQSVTGTLANDSAQNEYQFTASAGDFLIITMDSPTLDGNVSLTSDTTSSFFYRYDDDSGPDRNARLATIIPEDGTYLLTLGTFTSEGGDYVLAISRGTASPLNMGEPVQSVFDNEHDVFYYTFTGTAGSAVDLGAVAADGLDTRLEIFDPNGNSAASDDDSGGDFNPLISGAVLSADGTYLAILTPYSTPAKGTVTVTLSESQMQSLDTGSVQFVLGDKRTSDVAQFTGTAGETVQLIITLVSGDAINSYVTVTQGTDTIATMNGNMVQSLISSFVVPADGLAVVRVENYSNVTLQIALTRP